MENLAVAKLEVSQDKYIQKVKLQLIADVREKIASMERELTDDFNILPNDHIEVETFEQALGCEIQCLLDAFANCVLDCSGKGFADTCSNWPFVKKGFVEVTKLSLQIFEQTSKIIDDAFKSNDYHGLLSRFDTEIVPKFTEVQR